MDYSYERALQDGMSICAPAAKKEKPIVHPIQHRTSVVKWCEDVPPRLRQCTLESYEVRNDSQSKLLAMAREYAESIDQAWMECMQILLYGSYGAGKDHILSGISKVALSKGYSVRSINGPDFRMRLRESLKDDNERLYCQQYIDCNFLWVSDPTVEDGRLTDYQRDVLYRIVDQRWQAERPTWLSINAATREDIEQSLGGAVVDRLVHNAKAFFCEWESGRQKAKSGKS